MMIINTLYFVDAEEAHPISVDTEAAGDGFDVDELPE